MLPNHPRPPNQNSNTIWHERFWNAVRHCFKSEEVRLAVFDTELTELSAVDLTEQLNKKAMQELKGDAYALAATKRGYGKTVSVTFEQDVQVYIDKVLVL